MHIVLVSLSPLVAVFVIGAAVRVHDVAQWTTDSARTNNHSKNETTGTPSQYVRNKKLSCAAQDIVKDKVHAT